MNPETDKQPEAAVRCTSVVGDETTLRTDNGAGGERVEMADEEKARWMAMGYKTKIAAQKMSRELADWNLMKLTFGFFQWKQKAKPTEEQLYFFEQGYRHDKAVGGGGEKRRSKKGSSPTVRVSDSPEETSTNTDDAR